MKEVLPTSEELANFYRFINATNITIALERLDRWREEQLQTCQKFNAAFASVSGRMMMMDFILIRKLAQVFDALSILVVDSSSFRIQRRYENSLTQINQETATLYWVNKVSLNEAFEYRNPYDVDDKKTGSDPGIMIFDVKLYAKVVTPIDPRFN